MTRPGDGAGVVGLQSRESDGPIDAGREQPVRRRLSVAIVCAIACLRGAASAGVQINIGIPAPPSIVIEAPPRLVVVPDVGEVQYAPDLGYNYFFYGGQYYTFHEDHWFVAPAYNGPWVYVPRAHVPPPLIRVPVRYYKVPPGHAKRMYERGRGGHWRGEPRHGDHHDRGRWHGDHDEHGHGHGHDED
jgi:hypothetical protein